MNSYKGQDKRLCWERAAENHVWCCTYCTRCGALFPCDYPHPVKSSCGQLAFMVNPKTGGAVCIKHKHVAVREMLEATWDKI